MGYVGETAETIKDTVAFIKEYEPDFYRIQLWYLDRITPIWRERKLHNITGKGFIWKHNTMNSEEACDHIERIMLTEIKNSIWVPVHNFNLHNLYRLKNNGMEVDTIKTFLRGFSEGIKEGICFPQRREIGENVISSIKGSLQSSGSLENEKIDTQENEKIELII